MLGRLAQEPGVTIAIAIFAGMVVQVLSRHLRVPSIILLLGVGVLLGPGFVGMVQPRLLGEWLHLIVGFGVSVILFEGSMNLNIKRLRREARSIRQISTIGVAITAVAATLSAHWILRWDPRLSILFGTLVTVTGPTVITPLVRRMRLQPRVATVLEAEGIFVDAIGTILTVVALEVLLAEAATLSAGLSGAAMRLAGGAAVGVAGGGIITGALTWRRLVPDGLQRVFALSLVLAVFQVSNALISESGILAVVVAGLVVGNSRSPAVHELRDFKEELTTLLLGLLFVLLAADVRVEDVQALGWRGVALVGALTLIVRPLNIWGSTIGTDLNGREKVFLSIIAPRGIVAAAVASLFAETLTNEGITGGREFRAMVFLLIVMTVMVAGTIGTPAAILLRLRRASLSGYVVLGAHALGRTIARILARAGEDVVVIDSNPQLCRAAESEGLRVLYGSAFSETIQQRAELDVRQGCIATTTNDEVNLLFARRARTGFKVPRAWVAIRRGQLNVTQQMVLDLQAHILFGRPRSLDAWNLRLDREQAAVQRWKFQGPADQMEETDRHRDEDRPYLPMAVQRGRRTLPFDEITSFRKGDVLYVASWLERQQQADSALRARGFVPEDEELPPAVGAAQATSGEA
jgi:NhaP-type Na+/H+ or K+/H+ antiporter